MSVEEVRRAGVMARVKDGKLKVSSAAEMLGLSYRQGKRLWRRYRKKGVAGLVHGNTGRRSNQSKPRKFRAKVLRLVRTKYSGGVDQRFGPTLAAEHLASEDGLKVHPETLRLWMLEEGLWSRTRQRQPYRRRRDRKRRFGELVQLDGSFHEWLEKRGPRLCLMNMVDDATGETLSQFHPQETIWAAVDLLRAWVEEYGGSWSSLHRLEKRVRAQADRGGAVDRHPGADAVRAHVRGTGYANHRGQLSASHGPHPSCCVLAISDYSGR